MAPSPAIADKPRPRPWVSPVIAHAEIMSPPRYNTTSIIGLDLNLISRPTAVNSISRAGRVIEYWPARRIICSETITAITGINSNTKNKYENFEYNISHLESKILN